MKRILSAVLAMVMVLSLLPVSAIAESTAQKNTSYTQPLPQHNHAESGDAHICEHCVAAGKTGADAVPKWTAWSGTKLPKATGHYYLTKNINVSGETLTGADVVLCLNGFTVTANSGQRFYTMQKDAVLTILDCTANTVTPENQDDTGYRAGALTGATNYGFMFSSTSDNNAKLYWYDGIISNCSRAGAGALMSVQGKAQVFFYGGEVRGNQGTGAGSAPIYLSSANNAFYAEDTTFIGNSSGANGGVFSGINTPITLVNCLFKNNQAATGGVFANTDMTKTSGLKVTATGCTFTGNSATGSGGVFAGKTGQFTATSCTFTGNRAGAAGGVFHGNAGFFKAYGCTMTGNNAKNYSVICGTGGGVQVLLDSCRITENAATGNDGAVFVPNSGTPLTVSGSTYIYGNTCSSGKPGNVHLQSDNNQNYPVLTVGTMAAGAKIGINLNAARFSASKILSKTIGGTLSRAQVMEYFYSDDPAYMIDLQDDKLVLSQGHVHTPHLTACPDSNCTGHDNALYLPLTPGSAFPTSGSYYLEDDYTINSAVSLSTGTLNLCLNGKTLTLAKNKGARFAISGDAKLNITDCSAKTENGVYSAGKITGADASVFYMTGDSAKKSYVNIFEGIITENVRNSYHASVAYLQNGATLNLYGGEISGNTVGSNGSNSYGGTIFLNNSKGTFNMFGGKISGNTAKIVNSKGGNGAAVYSLGGTVNILGGEISGNTAEASGGAITANGGTITVRNAKITGNTATTGSSAICGTGGGVQIKLENAEITGNRLNGTFGGAVYIPNNGAKIIISGNTKIIGNVGGNVYLTNDSNTNNPNHPMITLGDAGLGADARIGITMPTARLNALPYATLTLGGKLTEDQVIASFICDNSDYEVALKDDRVLIQLAGSGHQHCVCGVEGCTQHAQILCKPWTDPNSLPTSGSYYLDTNVALTTKPTMSTGTVSLCLNGHTINVKDKRFELSGNVVVNITDCAAKTENGIYTAGSLTGAVGCVFYMSGDTTGKQSAVNFYQGVITGNNRRGFQAGVAYLQNGASFNMYGGQITDNSCDSSSTEERGGIIYISNKNGTFNMYGGTISNNSSLKRTDGKGGHGGAIYNNGGKVNLLGGAITGNHADGNGGAIYNAAGTVTITGIQITGNTAGGNGGAIYTSGGTVTVTDTKITGNTATTMSAIGGAGGTKINLNNTEITGNTATATGTTYGAIYIPNGGSKITVTGSTQIQNNQGGNLYLTKDSNAQNPNHPMIAVGDLTTGAKIGITMPVDRMAAQPFASGELGGKLTDAQVASYFFCDNDRYAVSLKDDRLHIAKFYLDIGHKHCACTDSTLGSCDHKSIAYLAWDDPTSLPTSGNYCLTVDVKTKQNVSIVGSDTLNLCLNGHTIEAAGSQEGTWRDRIFDIKETATLNITDCTGKGQLTGGTYGVILFEDNNNSKPTLNLYGGKIVGNKSISIGGAILLQGGATFNMYGGEISGNSMNGKALVDANGKPVLDETGAQKTEGTTNGGGAIGLNGANTTFNMYGGKITNNECLATTYLDKDGKEAKIAGRGGAIHATRGTVNIYGGQISGNKAQQGGAIYAVIYAKVNIAGGVISENTTVSHGAGIFADNCSVTISGGKITKNVSESGAGGIQNSNAKGSLTISGGEITENTGYYGGGVMNQGRASIVITGGLIARNNADTAGGVYVSTMSDFQMTGGTITENTAKNNAGGLYILRNTLDMTGGEISANTAGGQGGGIFVYGATLNLDGGVVKNNTAKNGAGLASGRLSAKVDGVMTEFRSTINLIDGSIEGNQSTGSGGGMLVQGYTTLNIKGGNVINNTTKANGGGVYVSDNCTLEMTGGTFSGNHADGTGGGVHMANATANFAGGVFEKNTTKKQGAGICSSHSQVKLSGVKIRNHNHKGVGAGYTGFNSKTTMSGGSISGNYASSYGAGCYLQRGTFTMTGGSITGNSTKGNGAGIYLAGVKLYVYGGSNSYNKCEGTGGAAVFTARWNYKENGVKKEDLPHVEIHGGTFSNNYGRNGGAMLIQSGATLKITGGTFTKNEGPASGGAVYVSTNIKFEITGGTFTENATESDGGAINFLNPQGVVDGSSGKLIIENNFAKRYGGGINITGDKADVTVKNVTFNDNYSRTRGGGVAVNTKAHANFENVEITKNHCEIQGGGFYIGHAPVVTMKDCHIHQNTSDAAGAGIATECNNELTLENCVIENNETKTKAGGIYTRAKELRLVNCKVINNKAGGDGGGIATSSQFGRGGEIGSGGKQPGVIIENSLIAGNTCVGAGGGIHGNFGNAFTLLNTEISGNNAGTEGSGIWTRENLKAVNVTVTGNTSATDAYAVFIADAEFDGQSFIQALLQLGGDVVIKDNNGGDMYMGAVNAIAVTADGLTQGTDFYITLDSGVLTKRLLGVYNYEKTDNIYHVTAGDNSMTHPETEAQADAGNSGNTILYIGVGAFAVLIAAAAVVLVLLKKKKAQPAPTAGEQE